MSEQCAAIAAALGVTDLLVLEREGDVLRLVGGVGRGDGWAGAVEAPLAEEPAARRALSGDRPVRVAHDSPARVVGPYWSAHAALVPVGDGHLVVAGAAQKIRASDGELRRHAAEAVAAVDGVPSAKLLADELEVVGAVRQLMDYRPESVEETARHVAEVAAAALSCEFAAVLVRGPHGPVVELGGASNGPPDDALAAELLELAARVRDEPLLEQDVHDPGLAGLGSGLVTRYALAIGTTLADGLLLVGHASSSPRGFTTLCQRVGRALADAAEVLLSQAVAREELRDERDRFALAARTDELTGAWNRAAWNEALEAERVRRVRYRRPVVFMSVDIDRLKEANDRYGHAVGDELLIAAASVLRTSLRDADVVARIGGDEFGVILPETAPAAMDAIVERIQAACDAWRGSVDDLRLSLSIGWAAPEPFGDLREALRAADSQMYVVKRGA